MPANKRQHFVPKCHMKPFSLDRQAKAINAYNWQADRGIQNVPVKGQCARDYFYGHDLELEKILGQLEGGYGAIIRKIEEAPETLTEEDLRELRSFASLQMSRTEQAIKRRAKAVEGMDELSYRGMEDAKKEEPNVTHEFLMLMAIKHWVELRPHFRDLDIVLLRNETKTDFVTSDDPAILINRLYSQRLGHRPFGIIAAGVQLVMPLTPRVAFLCYDRATYAAPNRQGFWLPITRPNDVDALNQLQFISCASNIYFDRWEQLEYVKGGFKEAAELRPKSWFRHWVGVLEKKTPAGELYWRVDPEVGVGKATKVISHSPIYPKPSRWVSELPFRPKVFAFENGSAVGLIREAQVTLAAPAFRRREVTREPYDERGPETALLRTGGIRA